MAGIQAWGGRWYIWTWRCMSGPVAHGPAALRNRKFTANGLDSAQSLKRQPQTREEPHRDVEPDTRAPGSASAHKPARLTGVTAGNVQ